MESRPRCRGAVPSQRMGRPPVKRQFRREVGAWGHKGRVGAQAHRGLRRRVVVTAAPNGVSVASRLPTVPCTDQGPQLAPAPPATVPPCRPICYAPAQQHIWRNRRGTETTEPSYDCNRTRPHATQHTQKHLVCRPARTGHPNSRQSRKSTPACGVAKMKARCGRPKRPADDVAGMAAVSWEMGSGQVKWRNRSSDHP